jgi:hypothetical protein
MNRRLFRLMLTHQKIDDALRLEQRRREPDAWRLLRLGELKARAKALIHRLTPNPRPIG